MKTGTIFLTALFGLICGGALSADDVSGLNARLEAAARKDAGSVSGFFTDDAYLFLGREQVVRGGRAIGKAFSRLFSGRKLEKIEVKHREKGLEADYYYELGHYVLKGKTYAYLCKLVKVDGAWKKEFEAVSEKNAATDDAGGIEKTQTGSLEASKERNNKKTVVALYLDQGCYLTRGELHRGLEDITKAWSPNIRFKSLMELSRVQAQDDLVYQIGKYNVDGFIGLFILVWARENGVWKVYLDSNV